MNKDVIYIEPEDDITDIITKIENSPEKITVLVPPKKAGVLRSVVNIKLIAKAAAGAEKTVVLVTVDPSIIKLAAAARIPVTRDLKTPPSIPELDADLADNTETEVIEDEPEEEIVEVVEEEVVENPVENSDVTEEDENAAKEDKKPAKKTKKTKKSGPGFKNWLKNHKIPVIIGGVAAVAIIGFLIWAFGFAPAATINVEIQTESKTFAENVTFTTNASDENAKEGKFYLQEKKVDSVQEVKFEASGKKNVGEKASGTATVYATLGGPYDDTLSVPDGMQITIQGLGFTVTEGTTLSLEDDTPCEGSSASAAKNGCKVQGNIKIAATQPGDQYNLSWNGAPLGISNATVSGSTSGGTNKDVTVVEQIDIEKAKDQLKASNEAEIKQKLLDQVGDNMMAIDSSFTIDTNNAEATPGAGQEVTDGTTPTLKAVTTATIYAIDKTKLEEFITEKANIGDDQRVYEVKDPFIESFTGANGSFSGRLKATYYVGPKITESEILDKIKGKGFGDVQHDLKNINGIIGVTIEGSYPWVNVVPGDSNKITINLNVKDQGNDQNQSNNNENQGNSEENK